MFMSESICKFMPAKNHAESIKTVHFVYESDFHTLRQPFLHAIHYVHLVTSGSATLCLYGNSYPLKKGTLFFILPALPVTIDGSEDFKYTYISFMGAGVPAMLEELGVDPSHLIFHGFDHMIDFWMHSIVHLRNQTANLLSEAVLLYTLSYLGKEDPVRERKDNDSTFRMLADYVDAHYRDPDLSLKRLAGIFSYTEKYLSHLFKQKMNVGFSQYLNILRISYASKLIGEGAQSVTEISVMCGYSDPLYFSKLFKKKFGCSPTEYIKRQEKN